MEPPAKKLRPYVTKFQRRKAEEIEGKTGSEANNVNHNESEERNDVKELFISDETVLDYDDRVYRSVLPRKVARASRISKSPVWCLRWCPKFSHLLSTCSDDAVKLYDVMKNEKIKLVRTLHHSSPVKHCDWSRSSRQLLTSTFSGNVNVFDFLNQGTISNKLKVDEQLSVGKWWKGDDNMVLLGGENSFLASFDMRTGKEACKYKFKSGKILSFDFLSGSTSFIASSDLVNRQSAEHNLIVWDLRTGAKLSSQIYHERYTCPYVVVHPSGANILAQTTGNYIARFSSQKPYRLDKFVRYQNHTVNQYPVAFDTTKDGHFVISGSSNGTVVCYKHNNGNYMRTVPLLVKDEVSCVDVQCHPVIPGMVAVGDWDGTLHVLT
uniref:WD repeat-containing protein 25 n=1 Tax=Phallusia mammillata TaxID=59560 RepID=A0A6F9DXF7_9ASCI|nr:WD repeat-containing protein 25 [Phallusia mammillata]